MGKAQDFVSSLFSIQNLGTVLCLIAIGFSYFRMETAEIELEEYLSAKPCSEAGICREKIESQIIESEEKVFAVTTLNKQGNTSTQKDVKYQLLVYSPVKNYRVVITPDILLRKNDFDTPDLYLPSGNDNSFFEMNLYKNRKVFIEIWNNKVTLLFINAIITAPNEQDISNQSFLPQIINNSNNNTFTLALVTDNHPLLRKSKIDNDFFSVFIICLILLLALHWDGLKRLTRMPSRKLTPKKMQGE